LLLESRASDLARPLAGTPSLRSIVQSGMGTSDWRTFHDFELDLHTAELRRDGAPVPLERQPAMILVRLVANSGRLVTRDDLRQAIWGDATHVDFDRGLNYCLRRVRLALGDDARMPRFIETVPRQGYRFIAPLSGQPRPARRRRWIPRAAVAAGVVALIGTAVAESGPRNEDHHRIAMAIARTVHDFLF
jgi:DNA-binding winged helix-turn-helix (wHTH) protein